MMRTSAACLLVVVLAAAVVENVNCWSYGRATFYGLDAWSIHRGSCGYGYLNHKRSTGWDVVAISDQAPDFKGSCGKCKEVRCKNMNFKDGYGQMLDRSNVCYDESASVVVMVTDTCPCHYPNNFHSNKRWCCMDMYHLDLSHWAYEKLADTKWGVIGTQWRDVPCWQRPSKPARVPEWLGKKATPGQTAQQAGVQAHKSATFDKRPRGFIDYGRHRKLA